MRDVSRVVPVFMYTAERDEWGRLFPSGQVRVDQYVEEFKLKGAYTIAKSKGPPSMYNHDNYCIVEKFIKNQNRLQPYSSEHTQLMAETMQERASLP